MRDDAGDDLRMIIDPSSIDGCEIHECSSEWLPS
jgi:hypothetical protein